jgi:hypothetical protein
MHFYTKEYGQLTIYYYMMNKVDNTNIRLIYENIQGNTYGYKFCRTKASTQQRPQETY